MRGQAGFFDVEERLKELSAKGDALERLTAVVGFELFRADLERAVPRSDGSKGGHLQEPRFPDGMSGAFGCGVESAGPAGVIEQAARPCGGFLAYAGAACAVSQTIRFML